MPSEFYEYFAENMKALHLPAPESLFGTVTTATATIGSMIKYIQLYGTKATVREMILTLPGAFAGAGKGCVGFATAASEAIVVIGAVSAAYYVGACIGSLAIATKKYFCTEVSIGECLTTAVFHGLETPSWLQLTLAANPALLGRRF